jgi:hypothetical protein
VFRFLFNASAGALLSIASLCLHAGAAEPKWTLMAEGTDYAYYVDGSRISDLNNRNLQFRTLIDLMVPDIVAGELSYSAATEWLMDCNAGTIKLISVTTYEDHCGEGQELSTESQYASEPRQVVPQSAFSVALKALCLPPDVSEGDIIDFERDSWLATRPSGPCSR